MVRRIIPTLLVFLLLISGPLSAKALAQISSSTGQQLLARVKLQEMGAKYRVFKIELMTTKSLDSSLTIFADDRGIREYHGEAFFVPYDPRRSWHLEGDASISYVVDTTEGSTTSGLSASDTTAAIDKAMVTWDSVACSDIPIVKPNIPQGLAFGFFQYLLGFGPLPPIFADISHAGWLPAAFFDLIEPNSSQYILGLTVTFAFNTDIDGNGKNDIAFQEVYYNDFFGWNINNDIDVETIALHESGHALCLTHFGMIFVSNPNDKLHFANRAVMNSVYSGIQQNLTGTDIAEHCSLWSTWPKE
jgi:hypothetical protein